MSFVVVRTPLDLPRAHGQQQLSAIQRLDLRPFLDEEHQGTIRWVEVPTISRTLWTNRGSVNSLKVSLRFGCSENAWQRRCPLETDRPEAFAIDRCSNGSRGRCHNFEQERGGHQELGQQLAIEATSASSCPR